MHVLQDTARTYLQFDGAFVWKRDSDIIQSRHFPQHISVYPYQWNDCGGGWGGGVPGTSHPPCLRATLKETM